MSHLSDLCLTPWTHFSLTGLFFLQQWQWPNGTDQASGCIRWPSWPWRGSHGSPWAGSCPRPTALPMPPSAAYPCPSCFQNLSKGECFCLTAGRSYFSRETIRDRPSGLPGVWGTTERRESLSLPLRSSQPARGIGHLVQHSLTHTFTQHFLSTYCAPGTS